MIKTLIGLLLAGVSCVGYAGIQTVSSVEPIQHEITNSPKNSLVLLDINGTLLGYSDAVLHPAHAEWKRNWFQTSCPNITKEEQITLLRIVESNRRLLDVNWPKVIQQTQDHGVKVVAFTILAMKDPVFKGTIPSMLKSFGLLIKDDLPELSEGISYEYAQGVIETVAPLKGPVLKEILSCLCARPEKIIFVDDNINQIKSVDDTCRELKIPCTAFHYVPCASIPQLDEKIADYQLSTLVQEHRWVSDNEACLVLEKRMIPFPHFPNKAKFPSLHTPKGSSFIG